MPARTRRIAPSRVTATGVATGIDEGEGLALAARVWLKYSSFPDRGTARAWTAGAETLGVTIACDSKFSRVGASASGAPLPPPVSGDSTALFEISARVSGARVLDAVASGMKNSGTTPVSSACMVNRPVRISAICLPAKFSPTPHSMNRNVSMLSSTPLTELTSSATASDVVPAPSGISDKLSLKRFRFTGRFDGPSRVRSAAAIAARASASVCASFSESESSPLTSSPSRHTRADETSRSTTERLSISKLSLTVRTVSSSSCAVLGEGCAESCTGEDGRI
mmetsp:Transcript_6661/g.22466  ORF Transcript_6661/g.22466 Transcript_6661/m.22466 type:complete len:281 (+) Transcript_6661:1537-2379(+)